MPADPGHPARNDASRGELRKLIEALDPGELGRDVADGWTLGSLLAHLAWWDRYAAALLTSFIESGGAFDIETPAQVGGRVVSEYVNAASAGQWRALPADHVRREAIDAAEAADRVAARFPHPQGGPSLDVIPRIADRARHRNEHLQQIAAVVRRP
ncbi:MAG TPA: maleylpyruvate isomerase N-terminal domain-containing protein [Dehalococcoidia bacterium]|nr:maleylpyruvate isomerase N-terminal domain-containing protein [Dehalococcoidia bacterium]